MGIKTTTNLNNFARGRIDHDLMGRNDLPLFSNGGDVCSNFITNAKGNLIFRSGFDMRTLFEDCAFIEFKFSKSQNYLCMFTAAEIHFMAFDSQGEFGFIESSPSVPLVVANPYTLAECRELDFAQSDDVMYVVHKSHAPRKLTRTSATSFTFATFTRTADPFNASPVGWPSTVHFFKGRLYYAATTFKITTVYGSVSGAFDDFTLTPVTDSTALIFTIADISETIEWLDSGENSLIAGAADGIVAINGGSVGASITAETVSADVTSVEGANVMKPIRKDARIFYGGADNRNLYYFSYDLLTESFKSKDANFLSYDITRGGISKIRKLEDKNNLMYLRRDDGVLLTCLFSEEEDLLGWHEHPSEGTLIDIAALFDNNENPRLIALYERDGAFYVETLSEFVEFAERSEARFFTGKDNEAVDDEAYNRFIGEQLKECRCADSGEFVDNLQSNLITYDSGAGTITATSGVFVSGDVGKFIVYKTDTGYESGIFEITGYTSATVVDVDVIITPTSVTYTDWYLTFQTLTGLSRFDGLTVTVVIDGGFLKEEVVSGGTIDLGRQVTAANVGLPYDALYKSFSLGFPIEGKNTQITKKAVFRFGMRAIFTAGGLLGTTPYHMEPVQVLTPDILNYLPPTPIDGTQFLTYTDPVSSEDKYVYIGQDKPLPMAVVALFVEVDYAIT